MSKTQKLLDEVLELDVLVQTHRSDGTIENYSLFLRAVYKLNTLAPILARMLQTAIEQRNLMYEREFGERSQWEKDADAELDRLAAEAKEQL